MTGINPYGQSFPIGATTFEDGVNFSLYSRHATGVELVLFDASEDLQPSQVISLNPAKNRTYHYWHTFVPGIRVGQIYGYRVDGPYTPDVGLHFDRTKVLLDPYGRSVVVPQGYDREHIRRDGPAAITMKNAVVDPTLYDWEGDKPLQLPSARTTIYEMHVRGLTQNPNSGVSEDKRGTYAGIIEKIPYLQNLGITAVELLPVFQFDSQDCPPGKTNYWGYAPVSFFAPHQAYSSSQDPLGPIDEFRDLVKALHRANIEVILDVVFNHTTEGDHHGPTLCFKGIDNPTYYMMEDNGARYANYTGCGNTLNANHPIVRRLIVDSLRYWVSEMHVDGFRFDLASILARDSQGHPLPNPPVLWDIESDPVLAGTKLLAEAWDAAGLYQVGSFIGDTWQEWNGRFRDDVRDFFRCTQGSVRRVADRLVGSPEMYGHKSREPEQSVNFVTCHDGFTLDDLVSYNHKHNEDNGEDNQDGSDDNRSWNCGVEGSTDDREIEALRNRQVKNFLTVNLLALGVPMILMGDEVRRTQRGNNNAYCQDNELSWFDWSLLEKHADVYRFAKLLIARRSMRNTDHAAKRTSLTTLISQSRHAWHGIQPLKPDWSDSSHLIALGAELPADGLFVHLILNAHWEPHEVTLPDCHNGQPWRRWIDTSLESPDDIIAWESARPIEGTRYFVQSHSVVTLISGGDRS